MALRFRVDEVFDLPVGIFPDEQSPKSWLLSSFLEEARTFTTSMYLEEIAKAESGEMPISVSGNQITAFFDKEKARLASLWVKNEAGASYSTEMPLNEIKQLLLDWRQALTEWQQKRHKI